jgi:hypothetical protein
MTLHVNAADERYCVDALRVITEGAALSRGRATTTRGAPIYKS